MKIALIAGGCVVAIIVAVIVIGLLLPKRHVVTRSARYRATPEQLFRLISGEQNWRADVLRCETSTEADGRVLQRETTRNGETVTYELAERVEPVSIQRRIVTKNLPYSGTWSFSLKPEGEGTVVRITEDGEVYNPVFRFVSRFIIGQARTVDTYLQNLGKATGQEQIQIRD
jgi:polyketide cyclase/dehydrase/lipid transport protein